MAIALADQLHASRTILACMSAILFYDAFASLPKEWRIIWNGRKNIGFVKACCVVNKYGSILAMIMYLVSTALNLCKGDTHRSSVRSGCTIPSHMKHADAPTSGLTWSP